MKQIEFPTCWEEVKPQEFIYLLKLRQYLIDKPGVSLTDIKLKWCDYVLSNRGAKRKNDQRYLLLAQLAETLSWQWKVTDNLIELTYDSTVNLISKIGKYIGPKSHGADLTFFQFRKGITIAQEYDATSDPECLVQLAALLYPGSQGRFQRYILFGIYAWFAYFTQFVFSGTFIIEGKEVCFAPLFESSEEDKEDNLGLSGILFSVAESGVFGTATDVDKIEVLQILLKMLNDKQQADYLAERMNHDLK